MNLRSEIQVSGGFKLFLDQSDLFCFEGPQLLLEFCKLVHFIEMFVLLYFLFVVLI